MIAAGPDHDHEEWERQRTEEALNRAIREPAPGLFETLTGESLPSFGELRERYGDPEALNPIPTAESRAQEVDFRAMLRSDPGAEMLRDRLQMVLHRPYLATQLVELLPREVSARLADRLTSLVHEAVEKAKAEIATAVTHHVTDAIARLDAEAAQKLEEVRRERFTTPSRFA
jgi:hypothetical protein